MRQNGHRAPHLPRDVKAALKKKRIAERPGDRGQYYVTGLGKAALNAGFTKSGKRRARPKKGTQPKKS
jgi:hypothetical protein